MSHLPWVLATDSLGINGRDSFRYSVWSVFEVSSSRRRHVVCRVLRAWVRVCMRFGVVASSLVVVALLAWLVGGVVMFGSPGLL